MKKALIIAGVIALIAALVFGGIMLGNYLKSSESEKASAELYNNSQIGVTADNWLRISEITEFNGKIAVIVENISDADVEYAVLTVKSQNEELSFNISALLSGAKAMLVCNEEAVLNADAGYTSWGIKDKMIYESKPSMHEKEFEVNISDGSVEINNISGEDISSDIYVYYKEKNGDYLNGSATGRFKISGLKSNSRTFVKTDKLNKNNCEIIFVDYDKEI